MRIRGGRLPAVVAVLVSAALPAAPARHASDDARPPYEAAAAAGRGAAEVGGPAGDGEGPRGAGRPPARPAGGRSGGSAAPTAGPGDDAASDVAWPPEDPVRGGDGRPGWRELREPGWWAECAPAGPVAPGDAVPDGLSIDVELPRESYAPTAEIVAKVHVTNLTGEPVQIVGTALGTLLGADGRPAADHYVPVDDDEILGYGVPFEVPAYEYLSYPATVHAVRCGDTSVEDETLGTGRYALVAALDFSVDGGAAGRWVSGPVPVRLDYAAPAPPADDQWHRLDPAPDAPCHRDGTGCDEPRTDHSCATTPPPHGAYGASLGLGIAFEPATSYGVFTGSGDLVVRNDGRDVAWLTAHVPWQAGWLAAPGGGPQLSGRPAYWSGTRHYRIEPGRAVRVPVSVSRELCAAGAPGGAVPLPPGVYDVVAGLYVDGYGWWLAPAERAVVAPG